MVIIKTFSPLEEKRWDEFIGNHNEGTIFHTSHWSRVIQKTYSFEPQFFINANGDIKFGFPFFLIKDKIKGNRLICLPFTDECLPLFASELNSEEKNNIISAVIGLIEEKGIKQIEIRGFNNEFLRNANFKDFNYYRKFTLDLSKGLDLLWKGFKQKSIRYPIKKAQDYGVRIVHSIAGEDMSVFYKLNLLTRKKHGVLPQPYNFFLNIYEEIIKKNLGFISIAYYKSIPIATSIFFVYNKIVHYKYNASIIDYLRYQPNHLILWSVIQWAVENGYRILDMGRTSPDNKGLMSFKRHWGAIETELHYYYYPDVQGVGAIQENSLKYKIASSIFKKLPLPILQVMGNKFYKYLG
uniref:Peptidoglycan bridge formation glycyltransferase FemA/FemB family protein n=1 Tax=candidate division WOR-3 bacterium TaxID=2052148 RepID=A0A7V1EIZ0_UNCW3